MFDDMLNEIESEIGPMKPDLELDDDDDDSWYHQPAHSIESADKSSGSMVLLIVVVILMVGGGGYFIGNRFLSNSPAEETSSDAKEPVDDLLAVWKSEQPLTVTISSDSEGVLTRNIAGPCKLDLTNPTQYTRNLKAVQETIKDANGETITIEYDLSESGNWYQNEQVVRISPQERELSNFLMYDKNKMFVVSENDVEVLGTRYEKSQIKNELMRKLDASTSRFLKSRLNLFDSTLKRMKSHSDERLSIVQLTADELSVKVELIDNSSYDQTFTSQK